MPAFIYSLGLTVALCAWSLGCGPEPAGEHAEAEAAWFHEGAREAGVDFVHVRAQTLRHWFPEIMSGGAAWLDYDGDGDLDLYLVQGGDLDPHTAERPGNRLFRNRGDGSFEDVTEAAGVGDQGYGMGCAVGDYDGDGDLDLYVTNVGPNVLYRNAGDGTFEDVTAQAGVGHPGWGTSAAFIDYDDDGHLDLYVVNYVDWSPEQEITCLAGGARDYCHPQNYNASATDVLYHNAGDGTFVDLTRVSGIFRAKGNGLGLTHGDFNGDGLADFYVANDGNPNQLWINQGDGAFTDQALRSGSAVNRQGSAEAGMGVVAADLENDGDLDLFITHLRDETNTLYRNQEGLFEDVTVRTGLSTPSIPYTGFGVGLADFDHDGALDLYVANGRVGRTLASLGEDPYGEPNQLFRGLGDGRFEEVTPRGGLARPLIGASRAAVFGDYDGDGDIDVLVVNNGGRAYLLQNQVGHRGRWILFRVVDRRGRNAIGAQVRITASGRRQWRLVQRAYSYLSSNDPRVHFGLAEAEEVEEVMVIWPGGRQESFGPFAAGAVHELREGGGKGL